MLPFTASGSIKPEEQTRMVEYYEGFLIAVDSLKRQGVSVDLYTYDTKGSTNVISSILNKPEMKNMDIIFGLSILQTSNRWQILQSVTKYDWSFLLLESGPGVQ